MFDLSDVFQFIIDRLDYRPFAEQYPVIHWPQPVSHVAFQFGNQLYAVNEQFIEKIPADVAFVADKFAIDELHERLHFQRFTVIDISGSDYEIQYFALVIADQMQLEAVEPTQRAFAALGYAFENLVHMYALIATYTQQGAVHETDACTFAWQTLLDEDNKPDDHGFL